VARGRDATRLGYSSRNMSSFNRPLSGKALLIDLAHEIEAAQAARSAQPSGRTARTLVKDGPLRVTLILLDAGGEIAEHHAEGPISVHVISGTLRMRIDEEEHQIEEGQMLTVSAGVRHDVAADTDAVFLLTVAFPGHGA